jgi:hypothetical protein
MSECCLPNLGCLSIPIISTNADGPVGPAGDDGRGILSENYEPSNGQLTFTFTEAPFTYTTGDLRGDPGIQGGAGVDGVSRLYANRFAGTGTSAVINTWESMDTYVLAADSLLNVGDSLLFEFEMELELPNITQVVGGKTVVVFPRRRISFGATSTSLTKYDPTNPISEPYLNTISTIGANQRFSYKTTVELIKISSSNLLNNFICRNRWDTSVPSQPWTNIPTSLFSINTLNPITFSLDIYQYQSDEVKMKLLTIDKITGVAP